MILKGKRWARKEDGEYFKEETHTDTFLCPHVKRTQNDVSKTISDVRDGRLSVNAASKRHDVPKRILRGYLRTKKTVKAKLNRKATLTKEPKTELFSRILRLAEVGYSLISKTLKLNVYKYFDENGILHRFPKNVLPVVID